MRTTRFSTARFANDATNNNFVSIMLTYDDDDGNDACRRELNAAMHYLYAHLQAPIRKRFYRLISYAVSFEGLLTTISPTDGPFAFMWLGRGFPFTGTRKG